RRSSPTAPSCAPSSTRGGWGRSSSACRCTSCCARTPASGAPPAGPPSSRHGDDSRDAASRRSRLGHGEPMSYETRAALTPERWRDVRAVFEIAAGLSGERRREYLARTCGDDADLEARVEELLAADARAGSFLEGGPPVPEVGLDETAGGVPARRRIGPYRVLREVGRGGMGTVYLAERAERDFQQWVAIKVVRPGFDSELVVRRFLHERQILA